MTASERVIDTLAEGYPWPAERTREAFELAETYIGFAQLVRLLDMLAAAWGADVDPVFIVGGVLQVGDE